MPLNVDRETASIRRMARILGKCVTGPQGQFYAFVDESSEEKDGPSDLPVTMRRVATRMLVTCATEDAEGIGNGDTLRIGNEGFRVWSQPLKQNDGLTTVIPVVREQ